MDIRDYIVSSQGLVFYRDAGGSQEPPYTMIGIGTLGHYVVLKGPATFHVVIKQEPTTISDYKVTLKAGGTMRFDGLEGTPGHPGDWNTFITVITVQKPGFGLKEVLITGAVLTGVVLLAKKKG